MADTEHDYNQLEGQHDTETDEIVHIHSTSVCSTAIRQWRKGTLPFTGIMINKTHVKVTLMLAVLVAFVVAVAVGAFMVGRVSGEHHHTYNAVDDDSWGETERISDMWTVRDNDGFVAAAKPASPHTQPINDDEQIDPAKFGVPDLPKAPNDIYRTQEIQIKVAHYPIYNRPALIDIIYGAFNNASGLNFNEANGLQRYRSQTSLSGKECPSLASHVGTRVRSYMDGTTTVDLKSFDRHNATDALARPLFVSMKHRALAFEKVEEDVKFCQSKFSRSSRVTLQGPVRITHCSNISSIWPLVFGGLHTETPLDKPFDHEPDFSWYVLEHWFKLPRTKAIVKLALTINYETHEHAINPTMGSSGEIEWSARLFLPHNDHIGEGRLLDQPAHEEIQEYVMAVRNRIGVSQDELERCSTEVREKFSYMQMPDHQFE